MGFVRLIIVVIDFVEKLILLVRPETNAKRGEGPFFESPPIASPPPPLGCALDYNSNK